jgi:hypothetical protein
MLGAGAGAEIFDTVEQELVKIANPQSTLITNALTDEI